MKDCWNNLESLGNASEFRWQEDCGCSSNIYFLLVSSLQSFHSIFCYHVSSLGTSTEVIKQVPRTKCYLQLFPEGKQNQVIQANLSWYHVVEKRVVIM